MVGCSQPQSIDAEVQVLGSCLISKDAAEDVAATLQPGDFYQPGNGDIYEAILTLLTKNKVPDLVTVMEVLKGKGQLEKVGGVTYLAGLTGQVASTSFAKQHAEIIKSKSIARQVISAVEKVKAKAYSGEISNPNELLNFAENTISNISIKESQAGLEHVSSGIVDTIHDIEERCKTGRVKGIGSEFPELTLWLAGYQRGELIIVAGRPGMGKTTFAVGEGNYISQRGNKVAVFSLEMTRQSLIEKLIVSQGWVPAQNMRVGELDSTHWDVVAEVSGKLSKSGLYIDDTSTLTVLDIAHRARKLKAKHGLDMIVIDYLQLISHHSKHSRHDLEVGEITRSLKILAKELNVAVILLSQLSRKVEIRDNKRPVISDLRDSGNIEEDADVIIFVYRDDYYNPDTEKKGIAEIIVAKQRNGPTGKLEVAWIKEITKFKPLAKDVE